MCGDMRRAARNAPGSEIVQFISSKCAGMVHGLRFWPVRKYPWGTCEALSSTHPDVGALKRLLFEEGYEELKRSQQERYYLPLPAAPQPGRPTL